MIITMITLSSSWVTLLTRRPTVKTKWLPALPLYSHICYVPWMVQITPSALQGAVTHIHMHRAAERKHKMFFAHLQHPCLLDMPSVGCTVSAPSPCTPPCIHSNTHTCTKYVSCCILATGKVITERAKELACCRAADLIPAIEKQEGRDFHCVAQHSTSKSMMWNVSFVPVWWTVLDV